MTDINASIEAHIAAIEHVKMMESDIAKVASAIVDRMREGGKVLWIVVVLLLPFLGFLAWLLFGPKGKN